MSGAEFSSIFHAHQDAVYRFAWRLSNSAALAEDVAQDVFVLVLRGKVAVDQRRGSVRSVLLGVARHLIWKRWRQDQRWSALDEDAFEASAVDLEGLDRQRAVQAAVAALPPLQRETLVLATYEELSLREIAETVGVELGTVKARLYRARENLKLMLTPHAVKGSLWNR